MKRQKRPIKIAFVASLVLALIVAGVALAADVDIDGFTVGQSMFIFLPDPPDLPWISWTAANAGIGGERDMGLTVNIGSPDDFARWHVTANSGYASLVEGPNVESVAEMQWDGSADSPKSDLNCATGLGNIDLTDGDLNDGIGFRVIFSNAAALLTFNLYTDCSNYGVRTITFPADVGTGHVVDFFLPFTSFGGGSGTLDPTSINAISFALDTAGLPGSDFQIFRFIRATSVRDFGDLPTSGSVAYATSILAASHIPEGLRLGTSVDTEASSNPDPNAAGDDNQGAPDDEDGVIRDMTDYWTLDAHVDLLVTVNGCADTCYFNGWIDWDRDGNFDDANDQIFNNTSISNGTNQTLQLQVPSSGYTQGDDVYARFRICPTSGTCNTVTATNVLNGEIEDYYWGFGPTAITLKVVHARSGSTLTVLALAGLSLLAVVAAGWLTWRRRVSSR